MKPAAFLTCLLLALAIGCDDGGSGPPTPDPEPEPTVTEVPRLIETRTFDGDGRLLFRDAYSYPDERLDGFRRYDAEGLLAGVFALERDTEGSATSLAVSRADMSFFRDEFFATDGVLDGIRRSDAEGLYLTSYGLIRDDLGRVHGIERSDRETGRDVDQREVHAHGAEALEAIIRYDGAGRLLAAIEVTSNAFAQPTRLDVSTADGPSHVVEYDYDLGVRGPAVGLPLIYALTDLDGQDLPRVNPP